jgi:uncharacterized membrane protein
VRTLTRTVILALLTMAIALVGAGTALAQPDTDSSSPEDVTLIAAFRAIQPDFVDDDSDIDLQLVNHASSRRIVRFELEGVPAGWDVQVWQRFFAYRINELALEPFGGAEGSGSNVQAPRLRIHPSIDTDAGTYEFTLRVLSRDGNVLYDSATFSLIIGEREPVTAGDIELTSTFPFLRGPATSQFEFEIGIRNRTGADASFDLSAEAPLNWTVQFRPAFGDERLISSVAPVSNGLQRVNVRVRPATFETAGTYTIPVMVSNQDFSAAIDLQVEVTGRGDILLQTAATRLNVDATAGDPTTVGLVVGNTGTGVLDSVSLIADAPDGWVVTFAESTIATIDVSEFLPVAAVITPDPDAIPGDYFVNVTASSPQDFRQVALRVTVSQSTIWGWLGIAIVVAVLGGLGGLFLRLGRR